MRTLNSLADTLESVRREVGRARARRLSLEREMSELARQISAKTAALKRLQSAGTARARMLEDLKDPEIVLLLLCHGIR